MHGAALERLLQGRKLHETLLFRKLPLSHKFTLPPSASSPGPPKGSTCLSSAPGTLSLVCAALNGRHRALEGISCQGSAHSKAQPHPCTTLHSWWEAELRAGEWTPHCVSLSPGLSPGPCPHRTKHGAWDKHTPSKHLLGATGKKARPQSSI